TDHPSGGAMLLVGYKLGPSFTAGIGVLASRSSGPVARLSWVPFFVRRSVRPVVALEVPVLITSPVSFGVGASAGVQVVLGERFSASLEVPATYFVSTLPEAERSYVFVSLGAAVDL